MPESSPKLCGSELSADDGDLVPPRNTTIRPTMSLPRQPDNPIAAYLPTYNLGRLSCTKSHFNTRRLRLKHNDLCIITVSTEGSYIIHLFPFRCHSIFLPVRHQASKCQVHNSVTADNIRLLQGEVPTVAIKNGKDPLRFGRIFCKGPCFAEDPEFLPLCSFFSPSSSTIPA